VVPTAGPEIPWQIVGPTVGPEIPWQMIIPEHTHKHISQRGLFDILKKKDISKQPASIVAMFARLSCAEKVPSVFEPPEGLFLELEQVCACYVFSYTHTHTHL
jgi:hypothetical protein